MILEEGKALFEAITDSGVLLDRAGRITAWNGGASALFGYQPKEVIGRSLNLVYQQNHPFPKIIQDTWNHQRKWQTNTPFMRKDGSTGMCRTTVSPAGQTLQGKLITLVTHYDLTNEYEKICELDRLNERNTFEKNTYLNLIKINNFLLSRNLLTNDQLEKNLSESELRFHLLAENATDIISRHAPDGTWLYVSPACKTLTGYTPEELTSKNLFQFVHHDDITRLRKIFRRKRGTATTGTQTYRLRRKDGEFRWFESNIRFIRDERNHIISEIQFASRDITDRILDKKARLRGQQLAHVFRLSTMEEMASGMAHEISQPLAAIVNYTQGCVRYLQKESHDPTQLAEIMNKAVAQAERAGEVIHRLKNFFCKGQLIRTPCKINSLIREAVSLIRSDLNSSRTRMDFDFDREIPIVSADRIQLQQVILNLIQNGIEAMKETPANARKIYIQTKNHSDQLIEITVTDTGPGFSKDIIHEVFKPFFTTKAHGRGMGLAICRSIIEAHGGEFIIHPNTHNNSWIRFTLPRQGDNTCQ